MVVRRWALSAVLAGVAEAQIRLLSPQWLVDVFQESKGNIMGSTATFGTPYYGERLIGRLVFPKSHGGCHEDDDSTNRCYCQEEDYEVTAPSEAQNDAEETGRDASLINIFVIKR